MRPRSAGLAKDGRWPVWTIWPIPSDYLPARTSPTRSYHAMAKKKEISLYMDRTTGQAVEKPFPIDLSNDKEWMRRHPLVRTRRRLLTQQELAQTDFPPGTELVCARDPGARAVYWKFECRRNC